MKITLDKKRIIEEFEGSSGGGMVAGTTGTVGGTGSNEAISSYGEMGSNTKQIKPKKLKV